MDKKQISLIIGARQVGKTTLMKQLENKLASQGKRTYFLTLEDKRIRTMLSQSPDLLFQLIPPLTNGERIILFIDEIQYLDDPSNFLKLHYDQHSAQIKLIVSGSSSFYIDQKFRDSLAGRKRIFEMSTLSFEEMLKFMDRDDLVPLYRDREVPYIHLDELRNLLYEYLLYGGYPEVVLERDPDEKQVILRELATSYVKKDATDARLSFPEVYLNLMNILAGQIGGLLNSNKISSLAGIDIKTVNSYLYVMRKSCHITIVRPFSENVKKELKKMPKVYFNDLGLRNHFVTNFIPIGLRQDQGALLENYFFIVLKEAFHEDEIRFWRTQKKQEVDFIIEPHSPFCRAFEVKFTRDQFNAKKYRYFKQKYPHIPLTLVTLDNIHEVDLSRKAIK
ncbi:ATP-binding protein [candidate division CSSED10-310 bacterium]|uniref:ATP-binding protein n=1 Tax=candidate division CSSED10-310 bacterium TaxID=2855610 RepID=A0ABV6YTR2_UNCC1